MKHLRSSTEILAEILAEIPLKTRYRRPWKAKANTSLRYLATPILIQMDTPESTSATDPIVSVSPNGDIILVVGPQAVRLRVHSLFLRSASKVFNAMFGPNWSEGQGLSEQSPRQVIMEEDDPEALRIICCVIHHLNDDVPRTLSPEQVFQIAIEIDKYDLAVALRYATSQWLKGSDTLDVLRMGYLMASAFLISDMENFAKYTLELILHSTGPYLELLTNEKISQAVPWKTICESRLLWRTWLFTKRKGHSIN